MQRDRLARAHQPQNLQILEETKVTQVERVIIRVPREARVLTEAGKLVMKVAACL